MCETFEEALFLDIWVNGERKARMRPTPFSGCQQWSPERIPNDDESRPDQDIDGPTDCGARPPGTAFELKVRKPVGPFPGAIGEFPAEGLPNNHAEEPPLGVSETGHGFVQQEVGDRGCMPELVTFHSHRQEHRSRARSLR